ncbi:DNA polymerase sliding clamp [Archaeoglobales archaeon]|nr:MAG: DNA polymerase sliding clamp [Archaeoglobales archaeon]
MFEIAIGGKQLKKVMKAINLLVNEARIVVSDKRLGITARDPANIALAVAKIPKEDCEVYKLDGEKMEIGVDIDRMHDIAKTFREDTVTIKCLDKSLQLVCGKMKYSIPLIDPSAIQKPPKVPDLKEKLNAKVEISGKKFRQMILLADKISEQIVFQSNKDEFMAIAEGDIDELKFTYGKAELIDFNGEEARAMYSIEYLKSFLRVIENKDVVVLKFGTDYPLLLEVKGEFATTVGFFLAPRISEVE